MASLPEKRHTATQHDSLRCLKCSIFEHLGRWAGRLPIENKKNPDGWEDYVTACIVSQQEKGYVEIRRENNTNPDEDSGTCLARVGYGEPL
jgi:hypothetical protein